MEMKEKFFIQIQKLYGNELDGGLKDSVANAIEIIPFKGDSGNKKEVRDYCIKRLAEGMNDYLCSSNYNSVFRQRLYEKYCKKIVDICDRCKISDYERYLNYLEIPIVPDQGIKLIKELHDRKGKTKEELAYKLGISERMVRHNLRKLDPSLTENIEREHGEFRLGGHALHVPIKSKISANGKKYMCTPNTLHPVSLQMNLYQTIILLESLMKEYYENSVVAIMLAATVWYQLSDYAKERIIYVVENEGKTDFTDFIDEVESFLEDENYLDDGNNSLFQTEKEMQEADWMIEEDSDRINEKHKL
ncbi:MAG: hypothetical protein K5776_08190 [Lachnospiraceae bacterium]|nr:hypothetical protein [Lachnospiraceae bacterium]